MNIGGANGVEGEFEKKSPVCRAKEEEREKERRKADMRDGPREIETAEGTVRVEKIFANTRDDPSGTERRAERKIEGGGENTRSKMSSSDPDLRRQGNRRWQTLSRVRAAGNREIFVRTFIDAFRGWLAIKRRMYPVLGRPHLFSRRRHRGRRRRGKVRRRREEIIFHRLGN